MDEALFNAMLMDDDVTDLTRLQGKYPDADLVEFVALMKSNLYTALPLRDNAGREMVYLQGPASISMSAMLALLRPGCDDAQSRLARLAEEIAASLALERIPLKQEDVLLILNNDGDRASDIDIDAAAIKHICGLKKGLDFINDPTYEISVSNINVLYKLLTDDDAALEAANSARLGELAAFANTDDPVHLMNDLLKAGAIYFYIIHTQPYPKANGLLARLLPLWFLARHNYPGALAVHSSAKIGQTQQQHDQALALINDNAAISGLIDLTPILKYFADNVYRICPQQDEA